MAQSHPRVVSLIASATEILHALDLGHAQVARSHECDWPPEVLELPALTKAKFKVEGASSREVDEAVKSLVKSGLSVYEVDAAGMRAIAPDVILTQDQCEVCAVSLADVTRAVESWTECKANVVSLKPHTLEDIFSDNMRVATALGRVDNGQALNAWMNERLAVISSSTTRFDKPRLAFIEWIDPPMSGGHWMPELIEIAGGVSIFGAHGAQSPWVSIDEVIAADPDVILVAPCGYDLEKTRSEMAVLDGNPQWQSLRAVREGRQFIADGNAYFNRPGPRLVESAEILAEILHPGRITFGRLGKVVVQHPPKV